MGSSPGRAEHSNGLLGSKRERLRMRIAGGRVNVGVRLESTLKGFLSLLGYSHPSFGAQLVCFLLHTVFFAVLSIPNLIAELCSVRDLIKQNTVWFRYSCPYVFSGTAYVDSNHCRRTILLKFDLNWARLAFCFPCALNYLRETYGIVGIRSSIEII